MSHFTTITPEITDERALRAACAELGLPVEANTTARGYNSMTRKGELVIRLPGPYDIAVTKQADGKFGMTCDWYAGHVAAAVGANFQRLVQLSGVHKATMEAKKRGLQVRRILKADGGIRLAITGQKL